MPHYNVTVIVGAYNVAPYIDQCLESLIAQTLAGIEILVVNDGSLDATLARAERYQARFPTKIRVINQSNRGIGAVRNLGIALSGGDYIGFVDGDDWVEPEMYETLYRTAEESRAEQVICNGMLVEHATGSKTPFVDRHLWDRLVPSGRRLVDPLQIPDLFQMDASVCKRLYRKDYVQRIGYRFSERLLLEDIPAHYEMLCQSSQVLLLDRAFYNYRQGHPARRTDRSDRHLLHTVEVLFRVVKILQRFRAGPELWANFIYDQDSVLRWMGQQIDRRFAGEFGHTACRVARYLPSTGIACFRQKFRIDKRAQMGVCLQLRGEEDAYMKFVRGGDGEATGTTAPREPLRNAITRPGSPPIVARPANCRVPIILYHGVADGGPPELAPYRVSPAAFRAQMQLLARCGYYSVSIEEWARCIKAQRALPGRPVIITFDDGYRDVFHNAAPVLAETGLQATIYVVSGCAGKVNEWDGDAGRQLALMDWSELRALQATGHTIGSHCSAHRDLTGLSDDEIAQDCARARRTIRDELGREPTTVAFPWGLANKRVRLVLAEAGYQSAVGITGGLSTLSDDVMDLPRIEIFGDDDLDAFALKIDLDPDEAALHNVPPPGRNALAVNAVSVPSRRTPAAPPSDVLFPRPVRAARHESPEPSDKLSFVLPIALANTGRSGSELARLHILLTSFVRHFDMTTLANFIVVTRHEDIAAVKDALRAFPIPLLEVVDERELCPELMLGIDTASQWPVPNQGWHRQQLLKLACFDRVRADFYMTLDADVIFVRPFTASHLLRDGRSVVNTQTREDYERLWLPESMANEIRCRRQRDRDSARILRMDRRSDRFYGETPVVLSVDIVRRLTQHLATLSADNWRQYLLRQLPWTEYSLYFTFAEATGLFDRHHVVGSFDAVLGMNDSLWSPSESYIDGRDLSSWKVRHGGEDTVAVVVQSYLGYSPEAVGARAAQIAIV